MEQPGRWNVKAEERQKLLIVLVMVVAGLFVAERFIYEPLLGWWKTRAQNIQKLRADVSNGKGMISRETTIRNNWNEMSSNTLTNDQPQAEQKVLNAISVWAKASGATINTLAPQWKDDAEDHLSLNVRVDAAGNMRQLTRLLYEIGKDPMALKLDSVELTARDKSGAQMQLGLQINGLALLTPSPSTTKKR
jgi:Tfp pilus assembly protein PilO